MISSDLYQNIKFSGHLHLRYLLRSSMWIGIVIAPIINLFGCANRHYDQTIAGKLEGDLIVEWRKPDSFVYIPSPDNPLKFKRISNGDIIQPDQMWTDGGSIPRSLWVFKNYSPWGYGPAFITHDWLFHMQDCQLPGYDKYTLETAATVMSEVMKTLMGDPNFDYGDKSTMYLMYKAVQTDLARSAWEDRNCEPVDEKKRRKLPDAVFRYSF